MAVFTHTSGNVFEVGNKEYYSNIINDISPMTTPVLGMIGREEVDSQKWEYYTSDMAAPNCSDAALSPQGANPVAVDEGRIQVYNRFGIFETSCKVTDSQQNQKKVGNISELDWKVGRRLIQQKQSLEKGVLTRVRMGVPAAGTEKGAFQGLPGIVARWASPCQGGTDYGDDNTTNLDITIGDLSDDLTGSSQGMGRVDAMIQRLWELGADPSYLIMSAANKKFVDQWDTSGVTRNTNTLSKLVEKIDGYEGSFGAIQMVPSRWLGASADAAGQAYDGEGAATYIQDFALMFQPEMVKLGVAKGDDWHSEMLARTGRNREVMISGQFSLKCSNPSSIGLFPFAALASRTNTYVMPTVAATYEDTTL